MLNFKHAIKTPQALIRTSPPRIESQKFRSSSQFPLNFQIYNLKDQSDSIKKKTQHTTNGTIPAYIK